MARPHSKLTAAAGEHFVAYQLARLGYIAALVREGSQAIDILASNVSGSRTVGIQVKTTFWAERTRGRGTQKTPFELQFPLGHHAVEQVSEKAIFCFVDLRGYIADALPDVYVIPARNLLREYKGINIRQYSYFRHHRPIDAMAKYKNQWSHVHEALREK
jgi:hypothetical protein